MMKMKWAKLHILRIDKLLNRQHGYTNDEFIRRAAHLATSGSIGSPGSGRFILCSKTLAKHLYALHDLVSPTTRGWFGRAAWTVSVDVLLIGVPDVMTL